MDIDIVSLPIEYNKQSLGSRYRLVVIAGQRARDLSLGAAPKIKAKSKSVINVSILETISGQVEFLVGEEAAIAKENAAKIDYKKIIEQRRKPLATDLSELEKDLKVYLHERESTGKALDELFAEGDENES